jgi:hypothetical protein
VKNNFDLFKQREGITVSDGIIQGINKEIDNIKI